MSASSCAADGSVDGPLARLLRESLACLAAESPTHHGALCRRLAGHAVGLRLDDECFELRGHAGGLRLVPPGAARCRLRTDRATILAVLDGRRTLLAAVLADAIEVSGPIDHLLALHEALLDYVHGAARSPSFPTLLQRLRTRG